MAADSLLDLVGSILAPGGVAVQDGGSPVGNTRTIDVVGAISVVDDGTKITITMTGQGPTGPQGTTGNPGPTGPPGPGGPDAANYVNFASMTTTFTVPTGFTPRLWVWAGNDTTNDNLVFGIATGVATTAAFPGSTTNHQSVILGDNQPTNGLDMQGYLVFTAGSGQWQITQFNTTSAIATRVSGAGAGLTNGLVGVLGG